MTFGRPLGRERRRSLTVAVRFGRRAVGRYVKTSGTETGRYMKTAGTEAGRYIAGKMPALPTGGTLRLRSGLAGLTPDGLQLAALALLVEGGFLVGGGARESGVGLRLSPADFVADFG